eukprot:1151898-Pelagomonas_calceolata.AAC.6
MAHREQAGCPWARGLLSPSPSSPSLLFGPGYFQPSYESLTYLRRFKKLAGAARPGAGLILYYSSGYPKRNSENWRPIPITWRPDVFPSLMVTMGGGLQPGRLADRLVAGLSQPEINP